MKTSFYFVLWTILQFIFLQIDSAFINYYISWNIARYQFEITSAIAFCIYWIISHGCFSQNFFLYEKKLLRAKKLEHQGETIVNNDKMWLPYIFNVMVIAYFTMSSIFIAWTLYHAHVVSWWGRIDWIGLVIYVLFSCRIIFQHINRMNSLKYKDSIPPVEKLTATDKVHIMDFIDHVKSSMPRNFKLTQKLNIMFSILSLLLGGAIGVAAIYLFSTHNENRVIGVASIFYLYGSLVIYYGVKDLYSSKQSLNIKLRDN